MSVVNSFTRITQKIIQAQSLFTHVLIHIVWDSDRKSNEEQGSMSKKYLKNNIILYSGYSIYPFINPQLVTDINRSNQVLHLYTTEGYKINQTQDMVPDYGKVFYYDNSIANILSIANLVNKYRFAYDSHQDDYFPVHSNVCIIKLRRNKQGMYVFKSTYNTENSNFITTVEENMVVFTSRQIDRAKLSRKIYNNVGLTTVNKFNHMVSTNMISNCTISVTYISNAGKIYGPSMASLKVNSTRSNPRPVIRECQKVRVQCGDCEKDVAAGSLASHRVTQHGRAA